MAYMVKGEPGPARPEGAIEPDPSLPRVCVIGAGCSGITSAKALYEARIPFDCFEQGPVIGGLWVYDNPNGLSGCYRTLEMNTSCPRMAYSDFPAPAYYRDYPMHWQVHEYFERYVDHFGIRETITHNTRVEHVSRNEDGTFAVEISGEGAGEGSETRHYDAVLVANGHHWNPRLPDPPFPGSFDGTELHSHYYRDAELFAGKRALIVGVGNSGMDIACAASYSAERTVVSARRGVHVIRKHLFGRPVDQMTAPARLPWSVRQKAFELIRRLSGDPTKHGMPKPDHKVGHAHPTLSDEFPDRLADGAITIKPNIRELRGDRVLFEDGTEEAIDVIVYCTGYKVSFPFFDEGFVSAPRNDLPLFRRTFHPDVPGLYFIGLAQPLGAIMPLAERQATWTAELLAGRYRLPAGSEMRADMEAERRAHAKRFYESDRHTMEVDFDDWMDAADREIEAGEERAAAPGSSPEIEARARRGAGAAA